MTGGVLRAFVRNPLGLVALVLLLVLVAGAAFAPAVLPYPRGYGTVIFAPPGAGHPFGTDELGRDVLAEVVWGARTSLMIGVCASTLAVAVGVLLGVAAAYWRALDGVVGVLIDLFLSLPVLPLMILVAALVGPSFTSLVAVIALFSWPEVARVVRSQALSTVRLPFVDAARVIGGSPVWIIRRHVLPAVAPVIAVSVVLTASRAVLSEAGLSFLGLGDPDTWSLGKVLFNAQRSGALATAWWTTLFPSVAILLLVVSTTLLTVAFNDARNPRGRRA